MLWVMELFEEVGFRRAEAAGESKEFRGLDRLRPEYQDVMPVQCFTHFANSWTDSGADRSIPETSAPMHPSALRTEIMSRP